MITRIQITLLLILINHCIATIEDAPDLKEYGQYLGSQFQAMQLSSDEKALVIHAFKNGINRVDSPLSELGIASQRSLEQALLNYKNERIQSLHLQARQEKLATLNANAKDAVDLFASKLDGNAAKNSVKTEIFRRYQLLMEANNRKDYYETNCIAPDSLIEVIYNIEFGDKIYLKLRANLESKRQLMSPDQIVKSETRLALIESVKKQPDKPADNDLISRNLTALQQPQHYIISLPANERKTIFDLTALKEKLYQIGLQLYDNNQLNMRGTREEFADIFSGITMEVGFSQNGTMPLEVLANNFQLQHIVSQTANKLRRPETSGHRIPLFSCVVGYGSG